MVLMFTASEGTPFSAIEIGCGAMRRPLSKVSVLPEPMPRRSIEATSPRASCGPLLISVMPEISAMPSVSKSSAIVAAPRASRSAAFRIVTGSAVSASVRRILEPVTVKASSFTVSSPVAAPGLGTVVWAEASVVSKKVTVTSSFRGGVMREKARCAAAINRGRG